MSKKSASTRRHQSDRKRQAFAMEENGDVLFVVPTTDSSRRVSSPKDLATAMIKWLPPGATMKSPDSANLLKAFDLVKAELQDRANRMAQRSVQTGLQMDMMLSGVAIAPDVFESILEYLSPFDTTHKISLVSRPWLAAARSPNLWRTLDNDHGLMYKSTTVSNMDQLLKLLARPQFACLRTLVPPEKVRMRTKALDQISKFCPLMESIDVGFSLWSHMKIDDAGLLSLPSLFPHLKAVQLGMEKATAAGIASFCERAGDRLVSIRIHDKSYHVRKKISDSIMKNIIARSCPNLEHFDYSGTYHNMDGFDDEFSDEGVIALLDGCSKLKHLALVVGSYKQGVGPVVFQHILRQHKEGRSALNRLYVVFNHKIDSRNAELWPALDKTIDRFEVLAQATHDRRINEARRARQIHHNW
jgi:hypothetical protein